MYKYPDTAILVFCKAPIAGQVKTRLMPQLTAQAAADIHTELTRRMLNFLSQSQLCPIQLWCSPDRVHSFFQTCVQDYPVSLHVQQGEDLGERMLHAIEHVLQQSSRVLLIGCDCPSLTISDVDLAINALQKDQDIVLAPAEDGGYVMIGMKRGYPELFINKTWGHAGVLITAQQQIKNLNLNCIETTMQWDVDTFEDLQRYQQNKIM
jgi:rSAM/selenodomain-associated transferase 1